MTNPNGSTAVALVEGPGTERPASTAVVQAGPARLLRPIAPPAEVIQAQEEMRELVAQALKKGRDYGTVPGIDKPFLHKPGAERVAIGMGCYFGEPRIIEKEIDHDRVVRWQKRRKVYEGKGKERRHVRDEIETGESLGLYRYVIAVPVIHRESGQVVGEGVGSCSTMESKYIDRPRDSENTALKMAHKRALVAATLLAFGLSDQFTQDEDVVEPRGDGDADTEESSEPQPDCPKCGGKMWDNRLSKRNPKAPDYKCRDQNCDGLYWPGQWPSKAKEEPAQPEFTGAAAIRFPRSKRFPELAGKPLGAIDTAQLTSALAVVREASPDLATAIEEVLEDRRVASEPTQTELPVEEPRRTPSAGSAAVPPPGKVQDAIGANADEVVAATAPKAESHAPTGDAAPDSVYALGKRLSELLKHPAVPKARAAAIKRDHVNGMDQRELAKVVAELEELTTRHATEQNTATSSGADDLPF